MEIASTSTGVNIEEIPHQRRKVYYKLRSIFPNISSTYVKSIVINPPGIDVTGGTEQLTNDLIEHLIHYGDAHVDLNAIDRSQNYWEFDVSPNFEIQYDRLIGIFPDADPEYMRDFAKNNYNRPQKINTFIEQHLEQKAYPTRELYVTRKKLEESFRKYFTEFDIKEFLVEFPDPIKYFEGEQRTCIEDKTVYDLLFQRFQNLEISTISKEYKNCRYNPSLTAKNLEDNWNGIPKTLSNERLKKLENHMEEFSFICHRQNIQQYLDQIKKEEEEALQKSKEKNELLYCECCFNYFIAAKCSTCDNGHIFCNDCISTGTEYSMSEAEYTIKCFKKCYSVFTLKTLKQVLNPKIYNILLKKQQETELASAEIRNLENCPFCDFKSLVNDEDKILTCINEDCMKSSCRQCKKPNHLPHDCADVFEMSKARLYLEEKMTKALVRTCYKCNREFVKEDGCNRMACNCGGVMCYICDKPVPGDDYKHFNGQGSYRHDLCPLYSDDSRQEAEAVIEVARITKQEILKRNPGINLDIADALLPILPLKKAGPHDQISNSNQLPEHALKVAKAIPP